MPTLGNVHVGPRSPPRYSATVLRPHDTSVDAHRRQLDAYRSMTPTERLRLAAEFSADVRALTESGIRGRHPGWSADERAAELARILARRDAVMTAGPERTAGS